MIKDPRIPLKNPILAGVLALLLPGLGHAYQGRYFKAAAYFVCILGLFFTGMAMAGWQAIQTPTAEAVAQQQLGPLLKYGAQVPVGVPVMLGWVQRQRWLSEHHQLADTNQAVTEIAAPLDAEFSGHINVFAGTNDAGRVEGRIRLKPSEEQLGRRRITGEIVAEVDGRPATFRLTDDVQLEQSIQGIKERRVWGGIAGEEGRRIGDFRGTIPRPFLNWVAVPMTETQEQDLHRRLGKYHELAMVFTWVAGLLNVLAIWDAIEGPAYGYDIESMKREREKEKTA